MRWPAAGLFFIILAFTLFIGFAIGSYILGETKDMLDEHREGLSADYGHELTLISNAFGFIGVLCLGIAIVIFIWDAMADEPEEYWQGGD